MVDFWTPEYAINIASNPKTDVQLVTVELLHPAFGAQSVRVVNQLEDKTLRLEPGAPLNGGQDVVFKAVPFEIEWPGFEEGRPVEAVLRVDNIGREVSRYLDQAETMNATLTVIFRVYLASDPTTVAYGPFRMVMREITETGSSIEGRVTLANPQNLKFLRKVYSAQEYPSLLATS